MPTRLLDIGDAGMQVVKLVQWSTRADLPYVALSYCWGESRPYTTIKSTICQHVKSIRISVLPRSLKDAVEITRKLGLRLLWIDSLCIVQDDKADWFRKAATMASVYGNTHLVIMAARSSSAEKIFLKPRSQPSIVK